MSSGMNLKNLYQNEYSFEETVNENFFKVESFSTLSIKSKIYSSSDENVINNTLYLIGETEDNLFCDKLNQIACYNANLGWLFYIPKKGNIAYLQLEDNFIYYNGTEWTELQTNSSNITDENGTSINTSNFLKKTSNLSDLNNISTARNNLNVYSKDEVFNKNETYSKEEIYNKNECYNKEENYSKEETYSKEEIDTKMANINTTGEITIDTTNFIQKTSNLSDLNNISAARNNLNVYSKDEVFNKNETFNITNNLSEILDQDTACHNVGSLREWEIRRVGDYKMSAQPNDHDNWYICDGREMLRSDYPELFSIIGTTCGAGNGTTTFNIPNFKNKTMWGADNNLNTTKNAGLPNLTGSLPVFVYSSDGLVMDGSGVFSQEFIQDIKASWVVGGGAGFRSGMINFNSRNSNTIYGNSNTVQPPALCVNVFILVK